MKLSTPSPQGVMTERQKQHSKLFRGYRDVTQGRTLRDLVIEKGDVQVGRLIGNVRLPGSFSSQEYFARLMCQADAVLIGTVREKSSNLVDDETFAFTEYGFVADEVLKNNPAANIPTDTRVTIVRASGVVSILGHVVTAIDYSERPLVVGDQYLLFLRFIPETDAYRSFSNSLSDDTFKLDHNQITQASDQPLPLGAHRKTDLNPFLAEVRGGSSNPCSR
jgi:hypothetical protein